MCHASEDNWLSQHPRYPAYDSMYLCTLLVRPKPSSLRDAHQSCQVPDPEFRQCWQLGHQHVVSRLVLLDIPSYFLSRAMNVCVLQLTLYDWYIVLSYGAQIQVVVNVFSVLAGLSHIMLMVSIGSSPVFNTTVCSSRISLGCEYTDAWVAFMRDDFISVNTPVTFLDHDHDTFA